MRVIVDYELCASTGMCTSFAPEVFELDAEGNLLLLIEEPPQELVDAVQAAVDSCPVEALALEA